jgi:hypothetical protein
MATQPTIPTRTAHAVQAPTPAIAERDPNILARYREQRAQRTKARLISARNRRFIAKWLRRTANHTRRPRRLARTPEPLLNYRVAAVRTGLLEIAALLEHAQDPDPERIAALHDLLGNGCDSPLYNPDIHASELLATLDYVSSGLGRCPVHR